MKIRVKIKHITISLITLLMLLPFFIYIIHPQYTYYMGHRQMAKGNLAGKEKILETLNGNILEGQKWEAVREYMIEDTYSKQFDVYIGASSTQWNDMDKASVKFTMQERLPYLEQYVENAPMSFYVEQAGLQLAYYYHQKDQWRKADEILRKVLERNTSYYLNSIAKERIKLAVLNEEIDMALDFIEAYTSQDQNTNSDIYSDAEVAKIHAELIIQKGERDKALDIAEKGLADLNDALKEIQAEYPSEEYADEQFFEEIQLISLINRIKEGEEDFYGTVTGRVLRNESSAVLLEGVGVFLREEGNLYRGITAQEPYQAVTNSKGEYRFTNVPAGTYQLFFGFDYEHINGYTLAVPSDNWIEVKGKEEVVADRMINPLLEVYSPINSEEIKSDKVTFTWESEEDATYYNISLGRGGVSHVFKNGIKENSIEISLEDINNLTTSVALGDTSDWEESDYASVLGFSNPEARFFWYVQAYNEEGDLLTQSQGFRLGPETIGNLPTFYLKNSDLIEADRLLLNQKPVDALKEYKRNYEQNSNDIHSLLMITRLIGIETMEQEAFVPYWERLVELAPSENTFLDLIDYNFGKRQWFEVTRWYEEYKEWGGSYFNEHIESKYAAALMKQGNVDEARRQYQQVMNKHSAQHTYVGEWIALELFTKDSMEAALEVAKSYPVRNLYYENINWNDMVQALLVEQKHYPGYKEELVSLLNLYFKDKIEELKQELQESDKEALKRFMEELMKNA